MKHEPVQPARISLRPRAKLLKTIGEELISSEPVAILELIKNAYDADATSVQIQFAGPLRKGEGCITVMDNGSGMTIETIRNAWMEPATSIKLAGVESKRFKRRLLGEKGIGRFAASSLADELEVITRPRHSDREIFAVFDWSQFDQEDKYLDEIEILWEERLPREIIPGWTLGLLSEGKPHGQDHSEPHGTILRMKGLKRDWRDAHIRDLRRLLSRFISPFSEPSSFEITLTFPQELSHFSSQISPPAVLEHSHYQVEGTVKTDGAFEMVIHVEPDGSMKSYSGAFRRDRHAESPIQVHYKDKENYEHLFKESEPPDSGPFSFHFRVWDRDALGNVEQITGATLHDIREDLDSVAGINIYRDGFRVLPYGEPKNDWLRLDIRRVQKPTARLSNNQIVGYVTISADANPDLKDQSNREGLCETRALEDLREMIIRILEKTEDLRYQSRKRKKPLTQESGNTLFSPIGFSPIQDHLKKAYPSDSRVLDLVKQVEIETSERISEFKLVLSRYQRLATLGQLIDKVLHDGRTPLGVIKNEVQLAKEQLKPGLGSFETVLNEAFLARFDVIHTSADLISLLFNRIEPFGGRKRGRPATLYLEPIIKKAFDIMANELGAAKVRVTLPKDKTLVRVDEAEILEIFINLISNSVHWLHDVPAKNRAISVEVNRLADGPVEIIFSDSGSGISEESRPCIFDPYYSTKPEGVGLGLTIVGEIVSDFYGGAVELVNDGPLPGATFRLTFKKRV